MKENRTHIRHNTNIDCDVQFEGNSISGKIINLSIGGAFVSIDRHFSVDDCIVLVFVLPGTQKPFGLPSTVRWSIDKEFTNTGFGCQFTSLRPSDVYNLQQFVQTLQK